jgi:hypothetical protein
MLRQAWVSRLALAIGSLLLAACIIFALAR